MTFTYLSILALVVAIALGFVLNLNVGVAALAFGYALGKFAGMRDGAIFAGFPSSLFLLLFGVMFLFGIAQSNDSLSLFIRKVLHLTGRKAWLIPFVYFFVMLTITGLGSGPYAVLTINAMFSLGMAKELKANPFVFLLAGHFGIAAGCCSPISLAGLIFNNLLPTVGFDGNAVNPAFVNVCICFFLLFLISYFALKGYSLKASHDVLGTTTPPFDRNQIITLIALFLFILGVSVGKLNPGGIGIILGIILVLLRVADEKATIRGIPWGTLIMLCGMSVLINVMTKTGGIELISEALTTAVTPKIMPPFMAAVSGVFSIVSVMSSVVIPTLVQTFPAIVEEVGGGAATVVTMVAAVGFGGYATSISPFSSGGGVYMAALAQLDEKEGGEGGVNMSMFKIFLLLSIALIFFAALFGFLGLYHVVT